ncbi:Oxysterol-binding protein-related protein 1C [Platanthera zijinensis]|uniref:Oxysterol-binding protein-related protein 1C n=1 Tax=Platanthera zijinensis TaxID=2320716 RepID=A0AAP0B5M4_9ASPA
MEKHRRDALYSGIKTAIDSLFSLSNSVVHPRDFRLHVQVHGIVQNRSGKTMATLFGKWDDSMHYVNGDPSAKGKGARTLSQAQLLWNRSKPPKHST